MHCTYAECCIIFGMSYVWLSWYRVYIDRGEDDIMEDVDAIDLVEFSDAVFKLKQLSSVHSHLKLARRTKNLHRP